MLIPLSTALIGKSGQPAAAERVLELQRPEQSFVFNGVAEEPVLSIGRGFSAPVIIKTRADRNARAFLMAHDSDPFNRWEAGQQLTTDVLLDMMSAVEAKITPKVDAVYLEAMGQVLVGAHIDPAFTAQMLMPPSENELALARTPVDPDAIHAARASLIGAVAHAHGDALHKLYAHLKPQGAFSPDAASAGKRSLRNAALRFVTAANDENAAELSDSHYRAATNMTDMIAGLAALGRMASGKREAAFSHFHDRFKNDPLVIDKWMGLQAMSPLPDTIARVRGLMKHSAYSLKNPNRVRSLIGAFAAGNPLRFHDASGAGYRLVGEVVRALDAINPQTAARIIAAFETWKRYDEKRQKLMRAELEEVKRRNDLSSNLFELITKMLG